MIDNFGDAGVCWRLARQLAREHGAAVTLYIDRPELIGRLAGKAGRCEGVEVREWQAAPLAGALDVPDVIVSAFGAEPPAPLRALLAGAPRRPVWVNLEYLSAEPWVDGCHGLSSLKASDGAREHFFYPGFTRASGGLLRERDAVAPGLPAPGLPCPAAARAEVLRRLRLPVPEPDERLFTLFCYPDAPLEHWLPRLAAGSRPTLLLVPEGVALEALARFSGAVPLTGSPPSRHGRLRLATIPFLPQDDYDALLRVADLNMVRGEDSWLRAHWARRPFVWQPYRQDEGAHFVKLDAFLERFRTGACERLQKNPRRGEGPGPAPGSDRVPDSEAVLSGEAAPNGEAVPSGEAVPDVALREAELEHAISVIAALMRAWSGDGGKDALSRTWQEFEACSSSAASPAALAFQLWTDHLLEQNDLASNLVSWAARKL